MAKAKKKTFLAKNKEARKKAPSTVCARGVFRGNTGAISNLLAQKKKGEKTKSAVLPDVPLGIKKLHNSRGKAPDW